MVKWNYLGHRRTVDPNKVKGMAKTDICITHIHINLGWIESSPHTKKN
jgi:hypothetical protein